MRSGKFFSSGSYNFVRGSSCRQITSLLTDHEPLVDLSFQSPSSTSSSPLCSNTSSAADDGLWARSWLLNLSTKILWLLILAELQSARGKPQDHPPPARSTKSQKTDLSLEVIWRCSTDFSVWPPDTLPCNTVPQFFW